jgi:hypothetical protein
MRELRILELLIALFIVTPLVRPFIKDLQTLHGLVWFPPLALMCAVILFPIYGFRPECIPLFALVVFLNARNLTALGGMIRREPRVHYLGVGHTVVLIALLGATAGFALFFSPRTDTALTVEGVRVIPIRDEARNAAFFLRFYGEDSENGEDRGPEGVRVHGKRPMILVIPPVIGGITVIDKVCAELQAQGFQAVSYARAGFDSPSIGEGGAKYRASLAGDFRYFLALVMGTVFAGPNETGRYFEEERKKDAAFLVAYLKEARAPSSLGKSSEDRLFLAGYGAGGSALVLLGESSDFLWRNPQIQGIVAVESPFWSFYQPEERDAPAPPEEAVQWFKTFWSTVTGWFTRLVPQKIAGLARAPDPEIPVLFIVSDRADNPRYKGKRYLPVTRSLRESGKTFMAAIDGAGILDYTDYPAKYPLYSAFFSGSKPSRLKKQDYMAETASLIRAFAAGGGGT